MSGTSCSYEASPAIVLGEFKGNEQNRFSEKVMVSAGVCWNRKTSIHFKDTKEVKVNLDN